MSRAENRFIFNDFFWEGEIACAWSQSLVYVRPRLGADLAADIMIRILLL